MRARRIRYACGMSNRIATFLILTAAFSAIFEAIAIATGDLGGGRGLYVTAIMWSPAMAALLTCRLTGKPFAELGFRWHTQGAITAWLLPLGYALAAYLPVWILGLGHFYDAKTLAAI